MSDAETEPASGSTDDTVTDSDNPLVEVIHAVGHEHVTAEHVSTFEVTADDWLTPAGDCIVGVEADRTPRDFDPAFRKACQDADATVTATIAIEAEEGKEDGVDPEHTVEIVGRGDPDLTLLDDRSMVGRTSAYTDDERTILVDGDGAAADLDRELVAALADGAPMTLRLEVDPAK